MARNVEIKARVSDRAALEERVKALGAEGPWEIEQDDTFFACNDGRLKLRDFGNGSAELIHYRRPDQTGPGESSYRISPTDDPAELRAVLSGALGVIGRVCKRRTLYLVDRTRIHIDFVEGLGDFLELEVVLSGDEPLRNGEAETRVLMERLHIAEEDLVDVAYVDLLSESD